MTQKGNKGMWLRHAEGPQKKDAGWLLHTAAAFLASAVLILTAAELTGFGQIYAPTVMLLASGILCAAGGILRRFGRQEWFYPCGLVLLLGLALIFMKQILEGICLFWNQLGDTWTAGTGWVLPELKTSFPAEERSTCLFLFSVFAGAFIGVLCSWMVVSGGAFLAVLIPGLFVIGKITFHQEITTQYGMLVLTAAVFLLIYSGWGRKKASASVLLSWAALVVLACLLASITAVSGVDAWAQTLSGQLHETIHERKYETKYTTLPEGDFSSPAEAEGDAQPALIVSMSEPEEMYLRGFVGAVLADDTWYPLDTQVLAENEDLLYWLNLNAFNPSSQFQQAASLAGLTENTVTVQNIGACSRWFYVPFSLGAGSCQQEADLNTDSLQADGTRIYVFSAVSDGAEGILQVLEYLQTSDEEAVLAYRRAESAYREFVYSHYLQVPEDVTALLAAQWDKTAAQYGPVDSLTSQQAQECARAFLDQCFGEEAADMRLPLAAAEGTTFQQATVTVMTLRYFGIPARYAEGYVISAEMASDAEKGSSIEVDSSCGRAWAEVYQDGIGWIPLDLMPGMEDQTATGSVSQNGEEDPSDGPKTHQGQELEDPPQETAEAEEPQGGYQVTIPNTVWWTALALLLLLLLLLWARRKLLLNRRERKFRADDRNDAVAWIFADAAGLLEKLGFDRGNGSMLELRGPIGERLGQEYAAGFESMVILNARAMFSSHELEEMDREAALEFHSETVRALKSKLKWYTRVWMKWILCLY